MLLAYLGLERHLFEQIHRVILSCSFSKSCRGEIPRNNNEDVGRQVYRGYNSSPTAWFIIQGGQFTTWVPIEFRDKNRSGNG